MKFSSTCLSLLLAACFLPEKADAVMASPHPFELVDPDGTPVGPIYVTGNENDWSYETEYGQTLIQDDEGYTVIADLDKKSGKLVSSGKRMATMVKEDIEILPKHVRPLSGVVNGLGKLSPQEKEKEKAETAVVMAQREKKKAQMGNRLRARRGRRDLAGTTGTVPNLVVLMRFSDHVGKTLPSEADITVLMNQDEPTQGISSIAPTGSVRDHFRVNSYGALTVDSVVAPWVTLPNTEAHYAGGQDGLWSGFHEAIRDALDLVDPLIDFSAFDADEDGYIDAITFLHSGYGAEWGGGGGNRIWSHKWSIWSGTGAWQSDESTRVYTYHISPAVWGTSGSNIGRIGVICHETGHFFGQPDMYDTNSAGSGIGSWELMANSWGHDGSQYYPPIASAYTKTDMDWMTPAVIATSGEYTLNHAHDYAEAKRINYGFTHPNEYLLIEYRPSIGRYDSRNPSGGGLLIWHVDETVGHNDEGYPGDANGFPASTKHYKVALLQADGLYQLEKGNNRGNGGDPFKAEGVSRLVPSQDLMNGPFPNTDRYQGGNVGRTDIYITDIGSNTGTSITFKVGLGSEYFGGTPSPTPNPTPAPTPAPTPSPTKAPTSPGGSHYVACGRVGKCTTEVERFADDSEEHEVRCCADVSISGWVKRSGCNVWGESIVGGTCYENANYADAKAICESITGGRMCTKSELEADCTRGSGCSHDLDLIWSSTAEDSPLDDTRTIVCGRVGRCTPVEMTVNKESLNEVRCCTDDAALGWPAKCQSISGVWGESDIGGQCYHSSTYDEAVSICTGVGARLCSKAEILDDCTAGTGCGHDADLVWVLPEDTTS